jgi:pimeloyl-ACP methyl ester carboxylesterase
MPSESRVDRTLTFARLLRWLGPWTKDSDAPLDVRVEHWLVRAGRLHGLRAFDAGIRHDAPGPGVLDAYVYSPRGRAVGTYVVSPGLHFAGPDDPRFDRFCRVLAGAGFVVVAPFVPAYVDLRVIPSAVDDFETIVAASHARFRDLGRPALFSISFGSWLALEVAARRPELVDGVVTFGGYADFDAVCRFSVDGLMRTESEVIGLPHDPMNSPALFLNLLRFLDVGGDTYELECALSRMCHRTWGRMELKREGRLIPFVDDLVPEVPAHQQEFFRVACGVAPGAVALVEDALARGASELVYASPRAALERLECPVIVCHARDDDVIPYGEALKLAKALPPRAPSRLYLTGLYGHSGQGTVSARGIVTEVSALLAIAKALAAAGRLRDDFATERR